MQFIIANADNSYQKIEPSTERQYRITRYDEINRACSNTYADAEGVLQLVPKAQLVEFRDWLGDVANGHIADHLADAIGLWARDDVEQAEREINRALDKLRAAKLARATIRALPAPTPQELVDELVGN